MKEYENEEGKAFEEPVTGAFVFKCTYEEYLDLLDLMQKKTRLIYKKKNFNEKIHLVIIEQESDY